MNVLSGDVHLTINRDGDVLVDVVYDYNVGLRILGNAAAMGREEGGQMPWRATLKARQRLSSRRWTRIWTPRIRP